MQIPIIRRGVLGTATKLSLPEFTYTGEYALIDDGDGNWRIKFLTSGTFVSLSESFVSDIFLVGGGGSGSTRSSSGSSYGAGGGGGYTQTIKSVVIEPNVEYEVIIGNGGASGSSSGNNGEATYFDSFTVNGGFGGTLNGSSGIGGAGGSGGAGYGGSTGGSDGGNGTGSSSCAGAGQGTTTREFNEPDGTLYSTGGDFGSNPIIPTLPNTGDGGDGGRGGASGAGASGVVVMRNVNRYKNPVNYIDGLNISIIQSETKPEEANENTIWVSTTEVITKLEVNSQEPEDPIAGTLWIKTCSSGDVDLTMVSGDNTVVVYVQDFYIYTDGSWQTVEAQAYQDGEWKECNLQVIFDGKWHDTIGFKTNNTSLTIVDNTVSPATVKFSGSTTNSNSAAYMELQINDNEALEIEYTFTGYQWAYIGISTDNVWYDAKTTNLVSYKYHAEGTSVNERTTITLPLSGLSGKYYLKIYSWAGSSHTFSLYNMRFI